MALDNIHAVWALPATSPATTLLALERTQAIIMIRVCNGLSNISAFLQQELCVAFGRGVVSANLAT